MKIITGSVAPGDQHGCPFKHNDLSTLRLSLQKSNLPPAGKSFPYKSKSC